MIVASGDIHFSYTAKVSVGGDAARVHQIVSSPIRNALIPPERGKAFFANNMCLIDYDGREASVLIEQAVPDGNGGGILNEVARTRL